MSTRQVVPAASAFAETVGYSRCVRVGDHVFVAGTAPIMADRSAPPQNAYLQAKRCLEIVVESLGEVGASAEHVVRTRIYLLHADDIDEVGRAHGEVFKDVTPVTTALVVAGLLDSRWLVEIEAEAVVTASEPAAAGTESEPGAHQTEVG
jgi:enamine deaminase RidA (YjgF/YER057c/UK114 family)